MECVREENSLGGMRAMNFHQGLLSGNIKAAGKSPFDAKKKVAYMCAYQTVETQRLKNIFNF
jgi:hypothetical protein